MVSVVEDKQLVLKGEGVGKSSLEALTSPFFYKKKIYYYQTEGREGERKGKKHQCERETWIGCLPYDPNGGPGTQPRHVP